MRFGFIPLDQDPVLVPRTWVKHQLVSPERQILILKGQMLYAQYSSILLAGEGMVLRFAAARGIPADSINFTRWGANVRYLCDGQQLVNRLQYGYLQVGGCELPIHTPDALGLTMEVLMAISYLLMLLEPDEMWDELRRSVNHRIADLRHPQATPWYGPGGRMADGPNCLEGALVVDTYKSHLPQHNQTRRLEARKTTRFCQMGQRLQQARDEVVEMATGVIPPRQERHLGGKLGQGTALQEFDPRFADPHFVAQPPTGERATWPAFRDDVAVVIQRREADAARDYEVAVRRHETIRVHTLAQAAFLASHTRHNLRVQTLGLQQYNELVAAGKEPALPVQPPPLREELPDPPQPRPTVQQQEEAQQWLDRGREWELFRQRDAQRVQQLQEQRQLEHQYQLHHWQFTQAYSMEAVWYQRRQELEEEQRQEGRDQRFQMQQRHEQRIQAEAAQYIQPPQQPPPVRQHHQQQQQQRRPPQQRQQPGPSQGSSSRGGSGVSGSSSEGPAGRLIGVEYRARHEEPNDSTDSEERRRADCARLGSPRGFLFLGKRGR